MKVAAIQMISKSGAIDENKLKGEKLVLEAIEKGAQLIVLPELWSSGYHLQKLEFLKLQQQTVEIVDAFRGIAKEYGVVLIVPFIDKKDEDIFIALAVIESDGEILKVYHKSFVWGKEQLSFTDGIREYEPIQTSVGKLGMLICYDIEFPEPSRILALRGAELIIVPSVWSFGAETRWDIQLPARALDNTVFVLGVNTVGEGSCGKTKLIDPHGDLIYESSRTEEEILFCDIDFNKIKEVRERIPYLKEYDYTLVPGGLVLSEK
ncbi:nitrilase-related carbon-nitrogen hydrolase [Ureibacillus sp. NPDC094379]